MRRALVQSSMLTLIWSAYHSVVGVGSRDLQPSLHAGPAGDATARVRGTLGRRRDTERGTARQTSSSETGTFGGRSARKAPLRRLHPSLSTPSLPGSRPGCGSLRSASTGDALLVHSTDRDRVVVWSPPPPLPGSDPRGPPTLKIRPFLGRIFPGFWAPAVQSPGGVGGLRPLP